MTDYELIKAAVDQIEPADKLDLKTMLTMCSAAVAESVRRGELDGAGRYQSLADTLTERYQ